MGRRVLLVMTLLMTGVGIVTSPSPGAKAASGEWSQAAPLGAWSSASSLTIARTGHTATLLNSPNCSHVTTARSFCGKVLVTGGRAIPMNDGTAAPKAPEVTSAVEIYDPVTATWSPAAPMTVPRIRHSAVMLPNGDVIVTGGETAGGAVIAAAELYSPLTNTWTPLAPMTAARAEHASVVVFVTGIGNSVLVMGGRSPDGEPTASAETLAVLTNGLHGRWQPAGDLLTPRAGHTVTYIVDHSPCGTPYEIPARPGSATPKVLPPPCYKVLVVGGTDDPRVELYNPSAANGTLRGESAQAGSLAIPRRSGHAATVLNGGRVLISGGGSATSEVWGPKDGTWVDDGCASCTSVLTAPMSSARSFHAAVRLAPAPTGEDRVLAVGGSVDPKTEIFEIAGPKMGVVGDAGAAAEHGRWSITGALGTSRTGGHTTTVLVDLSVDPEGARVLVTGGSVLGAPGITAETETYHVGLPGKFIRTRPLNLPRIHHTATTLHDGRVLVSGGAHDPRAEIYAHDPQSVSGRWDFTAPARVARLRHTATLLDNGRVLVAGGEIQVGDRVRERVASPNPSDLHDGSGVIRTETAEIFDPAGGEDGQGAWSSAPNLNEARSRHTATPLADGSVLVVGGRGQVGTGALGTAELYQPKTGEWEKAEAIPDSKETTDGARQGHSATLLSPAFCGTPMAPAGYPCGKVLVAGGIGGGYTKTSWLYDPGTGKWQRTGGLTGARAGHAAVLLDGPACAGQGPLPSYCGKVLVLAGVGSESAEIYDPLADATADGQSVRGNWTVSAPGNPPPAQPPPPRGEGHRATLLPQATVLVTGGQCGAAFTGCVYDALTGAWSSARYGSFANAVLAPHTATVLGDGHVLLAGGGAGDGQPYQRALDTTRLFDAAFPPDAPAQVGATHVGGSGDRVRVQWKPPARDRGAAILGYLVSRVVTVLNADGTTKAVEVMRQHVRDPDAESLEVNDVPEDAKMSEFEVRAINRAGVGAPGRPSTDTPVPDAPGAPTAAPGDGAATLIWTPPTPNGSVITGYRIKAKSWMWGVPSPEVDIEGSATVSATVKGLADGKPYTFVVRALSLTGPGLESKPSNEVVPGLPRGRPAVVGVSAGGRSALVEWAPPAQSGAGPLTSYTITASPGGATAVVPGEASRAVVPGLTNGTAYTFTVRAANEYGESLEVSSPSASVTPTLGAKPSIGPIAETSSVPAVTSLHPRGGPTTGGTEVVITGSGFAGASEVRFGQAPALRYQVVSDYQIVAVIPAYPEGPVPLTVVKPSGTSAVTAPATFHFGEGGWQQTGTRVGISGSAGTTTVLPSGEVLVVRSGPGSTISEIFDPERGIWTKTKQQPGAPHNVAFVVPPGDHPDAGKVLAFQRSTVICEGASVYGFYQGCRDPVLPQIYDPEHETWTSATSGAGQPEPRKATAANGPAVALSGGSCAPHCGKVLIAGGCCEPLSSGSGLGPYSDRPLSSAELYDPASRRWTETGSFALPRNEHTMTVLTGERCGNDCGKVLAVGGYRRTRLSESYGQSNPEPMLLTPPEIWEPATGKWSLAPDMIQRRVGHSTTMLPDGRLLVVGGSIWKGRDAPATEAHATATVEIYDPATRQWTPGARLPEPRYNHSALLLPNGRVLVVGGVGPKGRIASAELYEPNASGGRWISAGQRVEAGGRPSLSLRDSGGCGANCGKVLVLEGGFGGTRAELYTPPPSVTAVGPTEAPATGGIDVKITGDGLDNDAEVRIGGTPATVRGEPDDKELVAIAPAPAVARAPVEVTTTGGTASSATAFVYRGAPGAVAGLAARSMSSRAVELSFGAAGSVSEAAPAANDYLIRYSRAPITDDASFDAGRPLCAETGDVCSYTPDSVGQEITVAVGGLASDTRYYFAVRPRNGDGLVGDLRTASVRTPRFAIPAVGDLAAVARSSSEIALTFSPVGLDGGAAPLARDYVVKQSTTPILDLGDFESARTLCGGVCTPDEVDGRLSLKVTGLKAGTTYYYAARASDDNGNLGPMSNLAEATTLGPCPAISDAGPGQARYTRGYHLIGVPERTFLPVPALFGWFDRNSGAYSTHEPSAPVAGRGYWAYFACDSVVGLGAAGPSSLKVPLGEYRASMVGNPSSTAAATVSGHDFAATWDPSLNGGSGGYKISRYRERQVLPVGAGSWVFSYAPTTIAIETM